MKFPKCIVMLGGLSSLAALPLLAGTLPEKDQRDGPPQTVNTPRNFPDIQSKANWQRRARQIREQALVSCGLWPLPEKPPLNARIRGRIECDGYSVEQVHFQTHAGFYLAGNLYRPLGKGPGPFPAILNPHGHWSHGRFEDTKLASVAGRCINFARQGMIAFSYDMVGYNDTIQFPDHRKIFLNPTNLLWNLSLMGLQTWNSLRALDFLESLPDVDRSRLGCTGASGGGTQTFMLGAIDDRLAAQAPNVMVSHSFQGDCRCENAPGLRIEFSNMEIAAAAAPRPQLLVAASTDWTKDTMTVEGPAIERIYRLFNAPENLRYVRLEFDHNYNQASREQVYGWFGKWLRGLPGFAPIPEDVFQKEPDASLRVFPDGELPADAVTEDQLVQNLVRQFQRQWQDPLPNTPQLLEQHKRLWMPAWEHTLQVASAEQGLLAQTNKITPMPDHTCTELVLGRVGKGDRLAALLFTPRRENSRALVVLTHPNAKEFSGADGSAAGLAKQLVDRGLPVLVLITFRAGEPGRAGRARDYFANLFTTYNRTDAQEQVQDLATACAFARGYRGSRRVVLCGTGRAGLWSLLAAPLADAVAADCDALNSSNDEALLATDLFVPGLRKLGAFEGVAILGAPHPLLLHDTGKNFSTSVVRRVYDDNHVPERYREELVPLSDQAIAQWVAQWASRN